MSLRHLQSWPGLPDKVSSWVIRQSHSGERHVGHNHFWEGAISRRRFMGTAAGVTAAGAMGLLLGSRLGGPALARAAPPGTGVPKPIPGGTEIGGKLFHLFVPGILNPLDAEPSTITDFNGFIGYTIIRGTGARRNVVTGATSHLPYEVDMRFMKGLFVGTDGRHRQGAFALL